MVLLLTMGYHVRALHKGTGADGHIRHAPSESSVASQALTSTDTKWHSCVHSQSNAISRLSHIQIWMTFIFNRNIIFLKKKKREMNHEQLSRTVSEGHEIMGAGASLHR